MPHSTYLFQLPGLSVRDISVPVPLDWSEPEGETISVFAREVTLNEKSGQDLPLLIFLQGGPGCKGPRPENGPNAWLNEALKTYRVILLDQRGTGRSSPVTGARMEAFSNGEDGAAFLAKFGADSIVRDCEHIRKTVYGGVKWTTLGQSYGGWLTLCYLSLAPEGLKGCLVAGGLAGLEAQADDIYRRTYPRVRAKNEEFAKRYPAAREAANKIADLIAEHNPLLPDGDRLTIRRFQTLGLAFGQKPGFEQVLWMLDEAYDPYAKTGLSETFLSSVMVATSFSATPLFMALHESIYCQNGQNSNWAAERLRGKFPEFSEDARPLLFTGEMMYPWMLSEIRALHPFQAATEALAKHSFDRELYNPSRLAENDVPVAAVVYYDDMYVDAGLSLGTANHVGCLNAWVTNEYEHDGLRESGTVFNRLDTMRRDLSLSVK